MSKPDISRRCPDCGAAVQKEIAVCRECGREAMTSRGQRRQNHTTQTGEISDKFGVKQIVSEPTTEREESGNESSTISSQPTSSRSRLAAPALFGRGSETEREPRFKHTVEAFAKDELKPRVDKFKSTSQSMIDEASVDPTFRFLLVAALLFIFSAIMLIISNALR